MNSMKDELLVALFITLIYLPVILTIINIINLFKKKKIMESLTDTLTFVLGIILTCILFITLGFKDYQDALIVKTVGTIDPFEIHTPIASWSMPTFLAICLVGVISYMLIRIKKLDLPPLVVVLSMSGIYICSIYMIIYIIQISKYISEPFVFYLTLFPINYILCSIRAIIQVIKKYKEKGIGGKKEYKSQVLNRINIILNNVDNWPVLAIVFMIPFLIILICIMLLFGQRPDEAIKAFLETSDWTLSQKISPPPIVEEGHYLCTVSLRGHKTIVKPTRMGIRRGKRIVVNRQLCIANAFEDLIKEKTPRFHHFIRYIYDKYGYPLSKHINTAWQADIIYILMKPLEWIFLIVIYLFDKKPENRINLQYVGKKAII